MRKAALVTGAGQGIGRAVAKRLLEEGYAVTIAERDEEAGREALQEFAGLGELQFVPCDVSEEDDVRRAVDAALERFGRLDLLVNNAGIMVRKPVTELSLEEWNRVVGVNLTGHFLCARQAAPHLLRTRGAVVNIASTRALMSEADTEAYSASKGGIVALTHALAVSLGPEVRVNCVSPGWIDVSEWKKRSARHQERLSEGDHRQHPAGRVGRPEDVAEMVLFLAGERSGFVTGQNFVLDGGMTRKMIYVE